MSKREKKEGDNKVIRLNLSEAQVIEIGTAFKSGSTAFDIGRMMDLKLSTIRNCITALKKAGVVFPKHQRSQSPKYKNAARELMG